MTLRCTDVTVIGSITRVAHAVYAVMASRVVTQKMDVKSDCTLYAYLDDSNP